VTGQQVMAHATSGPVVTLNALRMSANLATRCQNAGLMSATEQREFMTDINAAMVYGNEQVAKNSLFNQEKEETQ
jgi:hypothetical protein